VQESRIKRLEKFKEKLLEWDTTDDPRREAELRTYLNQNMTEVRRDVIEARCYGTITISPPPAVGGLIMRDQDPFTLLFNPPYRMNFVASVTDMIDQTIGVLKQGGPKVKASESQPSITADTKRGYAFVAMPMDPNDGRLEDTLDAIKEAARRCGLHAERVDEPEYNERITDRILDSIQRAEYVIVDLSRSKPNVFFEAGYAHGIGKTPVYVAEEGTKLEFDLKDYPVIFYGSFKELREKLEKRLRATSKRKQRSP
jgi:hypothetical protein